MELLVTGSSTMAPLVREIADRFQALHPRVRIEVQSGGSGRGISDVMERKSDIGMASRVLTGEEVDLYSFAVARDGVCLILHKSNPVESLTNEQVIGIYTGNIKNWREVGGLDAPIKVIAATEAFSSTELFTRFFNIKYSNLKAHSVLGDNPARVKALVESPDGVVYISVGEAERQAAAGNPIKILPIDGEAAIKKTIRSGNFAIARPLLLVTKDRPTGLIREFINFSLSSQIIDIILKYDFIPYLD